MNNELKSLLDKKYKEYSSLEFIPLDPISIPKQYTKKQDIEIAGFFAAIFSWGRRDIIIKKSTELMAIMGHSPFEFIQNYNPKTDYNRISGFKHRTFNGSDLDFYIRAMQKHYENYESLEDAFYINTPAKQILNPFNANHSLIKHEKVSQSNLKDTIEGNLIHFYTYFSSLVPNEQRNLKHISTPAKNSACKRLCMYLRWMVRNDQVDFGLWKKINTSQLIIPLDVHVMKISFHLNLIDINDKPNWKTALKLTESIQKFNPKDPVRYDFALFGMSAL